MIDATLMVARDGAIWEVPHWMEASRLDEPRKGLRIVGIADGTDEARPPIVFVIPDRPAE